MAQTSYRSCHSRLGIVLVFALLLGGCVVSNVATQDFSVLSSDVRVIAMAPDVKVYRVTASGLAEPQAEWTQNARDSFAGAVDRYAAEGNITLLDLPDGVSLDVLDAYDRLHSTVGATILMSHYGLATLPTKVGPEGKRRMDWSLGDGVTELAAASGADYALFLHFRDYQASGGRVGMAVLGAIVGVSMYTGHQGGFASLVDLRDGKVVWFNNVAVASGNVQTPEGADRVVDQLLADLVAQ